VRFGVRVGLWLRLGLDILRVRVSHNPVCKTGANAVPIEITYRTRNVKAEA